MLKIASIFCIDGINTSRAFRIHPQNEKWTSGYGRKAGIGKVDRLGASPSSKDRGEADFGKFFWGQIKKTKNRHWLVCGWIVHIKTV